LYACFKNGKFGLGNTENRIDILIKDKETMHCIIIENKINNAGDTFRQLPKYYCDLVIKGYKVDEIIYISMDGSKRPDRSTWTIEDSNLYLDNIITYCAVSNKTEIDIVNGFLNKCLLNSVDIEECSFFRQYIDLLSYLRRDQMDHQLMEKFYDQMQDKDNYSIALSIRSMVGDLIIYRRDRIYEKYINNYKPFLQLFTYSSDDTVFHKIPDITNENIKIDIVSQTKKTKMIFWIQNPNIKYDLIEVILDVLDLTGEFIKEDPNKYFKEFLFPEEEDVFYVFLSKLLSLLEKSKETIKENIDTKNGT
jgi:hypothetical protein